MGIEPRDHGGSWVQIPSGARIFRVYVSPRIFVDVVLSRYVYTHLGGWLDAS